MGGREEKGEASSLTFSVGGEGVKGGGTGGCSWRIVRTWHEESMEERGHETANSLCGRVEALPFVDSAFLSCGFCGRTLKGYEGHTLGIAHCLLGHRYKSEFDAGEQCVRGIQRERVLSLWLSVMGWRVCWQRRVSHLSTGRYGISTALVDTQGTVCDEKQNTIKRLDGEASKTHSINRWLAEHFPFQTKA